MAKRNNKLKRSEELELAKAEEIFNSFREVVPVKASRKFNIEDWFKNLAQRLAFSVYEQHDVIFLLGPAGTGKSFLACMFALNELFKKTKERIVLTRPIVEAGENLGFLPGTFEEKTDPYMLPLYDCIRKLVPDGGALAEDVKHSTEVAPLAYLRGRTFTESVCILDEAQNCTYSQFMLFLTRLGENSKMIVTGDPTQSDIGNQSALMDVVRRLDGVSGIGKVLFTDEHIVRHRLVGEIIKRLQSH